MVINSGIQFSSYLKNALKKTPAKDAKKFLYEYGYACSSFQMPEYYSARGFNKMHLSAIPDWSKLPITHSLDFLTPKGTSAWRRFSFIHPYIYWHLVELITDTNNWRAIVDHLSQDTAVASYTVPDFYLKGSDTVPEREAGRWVQMAESDLLKDCAGYSFLGIEDIQNFYPAIYTHSIAWALHTKTTARADRWKRTLLGNKLDKLFQNARDGQTNGIPVGSLICDLTAEIILTKVDSLLTASLTSQNLLERVAVSRFRDDFRILGKTADDILRTRGLLNRILHDEFDLSLNPNKSDITDDIIEGTVRPWMIEIKRNSLLRRAMYEKLPKPIDFQFLRDMLIETYDTQRRFPKDRVVNKVLGTFAQKIERAKTPLKIQPTDISVIAAILRKMVLSREEVMPQVISLLEKLLKNCNKAEKIIFIDELIKLVSASRDIDYQLIWIYRLCRSQVPKKCDELIAKFPSCPLLQLLDPNSMPSQNGHYLIFNATGAASSTINTADNKELEKFSFVNNKEFGKTKGKPIDIIDLSLIKY